MATRRMHCQSSRRNKQRNCRLLRLEALEDRCLLATFTVANLLDGSVIGPGDLSGSLRQAVYDANHTSGADEIVWQSELNGTITLTHGELQITDDVLVVGLGQDQTTIDASGNDPTPDEDNGDGSRVFHIDDGVLGATIDVELRGLTITGGDVTGDGGAIRSEENLTVTNSTISDNAAVNNGGGIWVNGAATISGSTISGNSTGDGVTGNPLGGDGGDGGGIWAGSTLIITDSTITGNATGGGGSGIGDGGDGGDGGGIWAGSTLSVTGSTITGNATGDGGIGAMVTAATAGTAAASGSRRR